MPGDRVSETVAAVSGTGAGYWAADDRLPSRPRWAPGLRGLVRWFGGRLAVGVGAERRGRSPCPLGGPAAEPVMPGRSTPAEGPAVADGPTVVPWSCVTATGGRLSAVRWAGGSTPRQGWAGGSEGRSGAVVGVGWRHLVCTCARARVHAKRARGGRFDRSRGQWAVQRVPSVLGAVRATHARVSRACFASARSLRRGTAASLLGGPAGPSTR